VEHLTTSDRHEICIIRWTVKNDLVSRVWACIFLRCHSIQRSNFGSGGTSRLMVPSVRRSTVGDRAFTVAGPHVWNTLPEQITTSKSLSTFRQQLKTWLFGKSYPDIIIWTSIFLLFSARQHAERAICYRKSVRLSVCPSVCLSVTRVDQSKTVERIIEILSPTDRPNILVFRHQRSLRKSDGFTPNGGAKYKGGSKN